MQKKIGISLIVLVITIIIMTILAGAIILTLNNSGIINKATDAVEQSNLATVKELTQMVWAEAYMGGARTEQELKAAVDKALEDNKVDTTKYTIEVTTSGVTVNLKGEVGWVQQGLTVTNGTLTLQIGDEIAYDETNGGIVTGIDNLNWQILGVNDKGELLILSKEATGYLEFGSGTDLKKAQNDWLNAPKMLDELCEPYAKGKGAIGARNVNMDDYALALNFDFETANDEGIYFYNDTATYYYDGPGTDIRRVSVSGDIGEITVSHDKFYYYNGKEIIEVDLTKTIGEIATIKNNCYGINSDMVETIDKTSKAFNMLFNNHHGDYLLSTLCSTDGSYGVFAAEDMALGSYEMWSFMSSGVQIASGVRPVVILAPDTQLVGSSTDGWSIK